jgi:hypothetical protein
MCPILFGFNQNWNISTTFSGAPSKGQKVSLFSIAAKPPVGPTQLPHIHRALGIKRQGREADNSAPPRTEIKNIRATPPLPHTS